MEDFLRILLFGLGATQAGLMFVDEGIFHRRRGLDRFERWGHVADTLMFFAALCIPAFFLPSQGALIAFAILALGSCLLITKDEWIHAEVCTGAEQWCHAMLFVLHGALLTVLGFVWVGNPSVIELKLLPAAVLLSALLGLMMAAKLEVM
ncbi:MAG: hypothetical protein EOP10_29805, partial [Proteobacteria bacterium]